jgi:pimeloyl-ACP methyl ester carboxylesterase
MTKPAAARHDASFAVDDGHCAAWLFVPDGVERPPLVILGHGLGATREMRLDAYAERFARAGIASLAFTYRHFGDSSGHPRQLLSIKRQLQDWEAAITYASTLDTIDPDRLAIWGSSFGGGHVMTIAARHPELRAVISQCPFTNGLSSALALGPRSTAKVLPRVARDLLAKLRGSTPVTVPVAGPPGTAALMSAPDAAPGMHALSPPDTPWVNSACARAVLEILTYRPGRALRHVHSPILVCISETDTVAPPGPTRRAARRASRPHIHLDPAGHFGFYLDDAFARLSELQTDFLVRHLAGAQHRLAAGAGASSP